METREEWDNLPLDCLAKIGIFLIDQGDSLAAMRSVCRHWRAGAAVSTALVPLGLPAHYAAFPAISSVDWGARGHGPAAMPSELEILAAAAPRAVHLNLSGAHRICSIEALAPLQSLTRLTLDHCGVDDEALAAALPSLSALAALSLRGCAFLKGDFLESLQNLPLRRLDLADAGLALHLGGAAAGRALAALTALEVLDIGGNSACDATAAALASLPNLKALGLRDAHGLTEGGLEDLAAGSVATVLETLDLEGCSGLGDGCWLALARLPALKDLSLARCPALLQSANTPDAAAAALWRWPRLRRLCLAGSNIHPTKLKLLAATCGQGLAELDVSAPAGAAAPSLPRPHLARLTPQHARDLAEAARCLRQLRVLKAARTGLPLEAAVAFIRAAPRLRHLDLSGASLGPRGGLGRPAAAGRLWSSGVFMPGAAPYRAEAADVSSSLAAPGPEDFALALGSLSFLETLKLNECALTPEHLRHLGWLKGLKCVSLAGNRGVGDAAAQGLAAGSAGSVQEVDLSGCSVSDEGAAALAGAPGLLESLRGLKLARSGPGLGAKGVASLAAAAGPRPALRDLNLSDCAALDAKGLEALAAAFPGLTSLSLGGCGGLGVAGVAALAALPALRSLDLARCGCAVTDAGLEALCGTLRQLTRIRIDGARELTTAALSALGSLPALTEADLTCCTGLGDDDAAKEALPQGLAATIHLPQGGIAVLTGSPLTRLRGASTAIGGPLTDIF